jgi:hypothetical protein
MTFVSLLWQVYQFIRHRGVKRNDDIRENNKESGQ